MTIDPIARLLGPWSAELTAASILLLLFLIVVSLIYFTIIARWEKEDRS